MLLLSLLLALQPEPEPQPTPTPTESAAPTTATAAPTAPAVEAAAPATAAPTAPPTSPPANATAPTRSCTLAVLDLEAGDAVATARARAMSDFVTAEVSALSPCSVLSRADVRGVLSFEAEKQLMGCASDSCMAELADALGADYLVTGSLSRIDDALLLSLRMTNMKTLQVERRATDSIAGDDADAVPFVGYVARKLMTDDGAKIGPRPVARVKGDRPSTIWRPLFWTSFALTLVSGAVAGGAGLATAVLSDQAKNSGGAASQLQDAGPVVADVANGGLYAAVGFAVATTVLFFFPAEEER